MVKKISILIFCIIAAVSNSGFTQSFHIGTDWGLLMPSYTTQERDYHFAFLNSNGENQDAFLSLDKQSAILFPSAILRYEAKNRFMLSASLQTVSHRFDYNLKTSESNGFRVQVQTVDYTLSAGIKLFAYKTINVIPEIGITAKYPLSVNEKRINSFGSVEREEFTESDPDLAGVRSVLITNQTMDFEESIYFGRVGITLKYYNFYLSGSYQNNLTGIDKRNFYTSASQYSITFGLDILSFHLIKNQGREFENQ